MPPLLAGLKAANHQCTALPAVAEAATRNFSGALAVADYNQAATSSFPAVEQAAQASLTTDAVFLSPDLRPLRLKVAYTLSGCPATPVVPKGTLPGFKIGTVTYCALANPTTGAYAYLADGSLTGAAPVATALEWQPALIASGSVKLVWDLNKPCPTPGQLALVEASRIIGKSTAQLAQLIDAGLAQTSPVPCRDEWLTGPDGIRRKTLLIAGNRFELTDQAGRITITGSWQDFGKCPDCPAKAEAALQRALANVPGSLNEQTQIIPASTQPYGSAGAIVYQPMKLMDLLTNLSQTYNSLLEKAQVPPQAWQPGQRFYVRDNTGVISGAIDQALEEAKDLPELVGLGLSVAADPQGAYNQLSSFGQTMSWDKAQDLAEGLAKGAIQYDNFSKGGAYARYGTGRVGVTLALITASGGLLAVIKDAPNQLKKRLDDVLALLTKLKKRLKDDFNWNDTDLDRFGDIFQTAAAPDGESFLAKMDAGEIDADASKMLLDFRNLSRIYANANKLKIIKQQLPDGVSIDDVLKTLKTFEGRGSVNQLLDDMYVALNKGDIEGFKAAFDGKLRYNQTTAFSLTDFPVIVPDGTVTDLVAARKAARDAANELRSTGSTYDNALKSYMQTVIESSE